MIDWMKWLTWSVKITDGMTDGTSTVMADKQWVYTCINSVVLMSKCVWSVCSWLILATDG